MTGRTREILSEHRLMAVVFLVCVVLRLPLASHSREFVLLAQDVNPINLVQYYLNNDLPAADNLEIGENKKTFVFTSAYFYTQLVAYKLGIPFDVFNKLHVVLGYPLLLLCLYFLAYVVFKDKTFAVFSALFFYLNPWIFELNIGYPLLFDKMVYYGDVPHIPAVLVLAFLISGRFTAAGAACLVLTLLNPTYGANAALILFASAVLARDPVSRIRKMAPGLVLAVAGMALAFVMIRISTPIHSPVPQAVRDFCIRTYGHTTPHILFPELFLQRFSLMVCVMAFAMYFESRLRGIMDAPDNPGALGFSRVFTAVLILNAFVLYFILYVASPGLFVMLSPSKTLFFAVMLVNVYLSLAFYLAMLWNRWYVGVPLFLCYAFLVVQNHSKAALLLVICFCTYSVFIRLKNGRRGPAARTAAAVCVLALVLFTARGMARVVKNPDLQYAAALYDVQVKMPGTLPENAILTPYKVPDSSNIYGPFHSWPIRTYSRTGGLVYWVVGRNAYFDSKEIMDTEQKAYSIAGINLWPDMLRDSRRLISEQPLAYYFGIHRDHGSVMLYQTAAWGLYTSYTDRLLHTIESWDFETYLKYAGELGATHVVVCRDPDHPGPPVQAVVENAYFAVVPVPR